MVIYLFTNTVNEQALLSGIWCKIIGCSGFSLFSFLCLVVCLLLRTKGTQALSGTRNFSDARKKDSPFGNAGCQCSISTGMMYDDIFSGFHWALMWIQPDSEQHPHLTAPSPMEWVPMCLQWSGSLSSTFNHMQYNSRNAWFYRLIEMCKGVMSLVSAPLQMFGGFAHQIWHSCGCTHLLMAWAGF